METVAGLDERAGGMTNRETSSGRVDLTTLRERAEVAGPFYVKTTGRTLLALVAAVEAAQEYADLAEAEMATSETDFEQWRDAYAVSRRRLDAALVPFAAAEEGRPC